MSEINGEEIVQARIRGESTRAIARRFSYTAPKVSGALDRLPTS